jgi:transposase
VKCFCEGRECATDEERSGQPKTSINEENITQIRQMLRENHLMTVKSIAE